MNKPPNHLPVSLFLPFPLLFYPINRTRSIPAPLCRIDPPLPRITLRPLSRPFKSRRTKEPSQALLSELIRRKPLLLDGHSPRLWCSNFKNNSYCGLSTLFGGGVFACLGSLAARWFFNIARLHLPCNVILIVGRARHHLNTSWTRTESCVQVASQRLPTERWSWSRTRPRTQITLVFGANSVARLHSK